MELDGFRSIAVFLVVFFHMSIYTSLIPGFNTIMAIGWRGVSLFFILSAFLLSVPYIKAGIEKKDLPSAGTFFKKRLLRILPLYYFILLMFLLTELLILNRTVDINNFLMNIFFLGDHEPITPVLWSLKVEMRFYLVFPLLGYFMYKLILLGKENLVLILLGLACVVPLMYRWILASNKGYLGSFLLPMNDTFYNFDCFIFGILGAVIYMCWFPKINKEMLPKIIAFAVLFLSFLLFFLVASKPVSLGFLWNGSLELTLVNIAFSLAILASLSLKDTFWNTFLNSRAMVFISMISYSVYLWHFWIYHWIDNLFDQDIQDNLKLSLAVKFASLLATLLVSIITYYFVEKPFLKKKVVESKIYADKPLFSD